METRTEIWKPVDGFEWFYEVSDLGNVRSLNYHNWGIAKNLTPVLDKDGYLRVCLSMNGKQYNRTVHRMVALAFLDNPENLPQINHVNEDKSDNRVCNLEWCTCEYNNNYGTRNERVSSSKRNTNCKKILQLDLNGNLIREWESLQEIGRQLGYGVAHISRVCRGIKKTGYGFKWRFAA